MAELPAYPDSKGDTGDDAGAGPDRGSTTVYPGTPPWVKIVGIIVIVLVLLVAIIRFTGVGGPHGPGRHMPSGGAPPANVTGDDRSSGGGAGGQTPPVAHGAQRP